MANKKKKERQKIKSAGFDGEQLRTLVHYWWECKIVLLLGKIVGQFLKRVRAELPSGPAISLVYIVYTAALFTTAKDENNIDR